MAEKFYITTPIYYPSRKFTLGNCYTTVICDAVARFNKLLGKEVFFMTGTDEHGQKIAQAAKNAGKTEMEYLDENIIWIWKEENLSSRRFSTIQILGDKVNLFYYV